VITRFTLAVEPSRSALEPQPPKRTGEARPRLLIRPLELRQARDQELRVVERDERSLEARPAQEPHRRRIELLRILARDQDEQRGRLVEADVGEIRGRHPSSEQVTSSQGAA
jgi:hypothetical protein